MNAEDSLTTDFLNQTGQRLTRSLTKESKVISVAALTRLLSLALVLAQLYENVQSQNMEPSDRSLTRLFRQQHQEQLDTIEAIVDRIQTLGGAAIACSSDLTLELQTGAVLFTSETTICLEDIFAAHYAILGKAKCLKQAVQNTGDSATSAIIAEKIVRVNELQCWSLSSHLDRGYAAQTSAASKVHDRG